METSTQNNPQLKNIRDIPKLETYTKFNLTVLIILRVNRVDIYDRKKTARAIIFNIHRLVSRSNSCNAQSAFYTVCCLDPSVDKSVASDVSSLPLLQLASSAEASSRSLSRAV